MRKIKVDGKDIIFFNNKKTVPSINVIKNTYRKIQDNKNIPLMFMTRKQYLDMYIDNQEKKHNVDFPKIQEQQYIKKEMPFYNTIQGRYTTKSNKYFKPAVVFFNDNKITPQQFKSIAFHEYGHEVAERKGLKMPRIDEEKYANKWMKKKMIGDKK